MLLIPTRTPQTLTLSLSFLYCTGVPTPFELYGGEGGFGGLLVVLFFFSVCLFVFVLANWCIFRYHLVPMWISLLTTVESVCQIPFLRVSEGEALVCFLREPIYFLHFKKNQNVPEFQIPHAKMSPETREEKKKKNEL